MQRWILFFLLVCPMIGQAQSRDWRITKTEWSQADEQRFGEFVARLGEAVEKRQCWDVKECLKSPANPYAGTDPADLRLFADCADLPYYLRSYFAWKNGLPMSIQSGIRARDASQANKDVRYSRFGNYVSRRFDILTKERNGRVYFPDGVNLLNRAIIDMTYTASFRMQGLEDRGLMTDFYPTKMGREFIRLGTVIYDPNGHVAIVYKITDDGRIFYIDSHPDNTITSGMYTSKFMRSQPEQGAGFKNFRPLRLVGASYRGGYYVGGRIEGARNRELRDFGTEQFYGTTPDPSGDWRKGQFTINGHVVSYYDYLRLKMARGDLRIDPLRDMQALLQDICISLKDRVVAVEVAVKAGIHLKPHPDRLPPNIYGTSGEWEAYASPSRDARLKMSYMDVLAAAKDFMVRYRVGDPTIVYHGHNLAADLLAVYERESRACQYSYQTSSGAMVGLDLEEGRKRLFAMSFDPYHCPELRWGASSPQELASCQDDPYKRQWYTQERWLRNQWERRYDSRMDYTLEELDGPKPGAGIENPPDVDVVKFLKAQ